MDNSYTRTGINSEQSSCRPCGTELVGRYRLSDPIDRGGFSIIYYAADLQTGRRVAVKECTIPSEKERFLREAKLLEDLTEEDSIVSVLDFFEIDGTAFIVMEFLNGETLRENIKNKGKWNIEDAVRYMSPVMKTLERMHQKGVIHRDISPDNIMVMDDGSLKLLDFGAAKQYEDSTLSRMVVKASYSPPEQMDAKGIFGSWSDVYSVCATIYFCITGTNPEDAISRLMFDELKKPTELGAAIPPNAEKTLMKGMALDSRDRIQDMDILRTELENASPLLTDEERRLRARKKAIITLLIVASVIVATSVILACINEQKICEAVHFRSGRETIVFDGSNMSEAEFNRNADIVEDRVKAITEGECTSERTRRTISIDLPTHTFDKLEWDCIYCPEDYEATPIGLLGSPGNITLFVDTNGDDKYSGAYSIIPSRDIASVELERDSYPESMKLEFTEAAQKRMKAFLCKEGAECILKMDGESGIQVDFYSNGDGKSIDSVIFSDWKEQLIKRAIATKAEFLTDFFTVRRKWDNSGDQLDTEGQRAGKILLKYEVGHSDLNYFEKRKRVRETERKLNDRLDYLGVDHTIGVERYDKESVIIEVPAGAVSYDLAAILGEDADDYDFGLGRATRQKDGPHWIKKIELVESNEKAYFIISTANGVNDEKKDDLLYYLNSLKEDGESKLYMTYKNMPLACADLGKAIYSVERGQDIILSEWYAPDDSKEDIVRIARLLMYSYDTYDTYERGNCKFKGIQPVDNRGHVVAEKFPVADTTIVDKKANDYITEWREKYKGKLLFARSRDINNDYESDDPAIRSIRIYDFGEMSTDRPFKETMDRFCSFYKDNRSKLEDGTFICVRYIYNTISICTTVDDNGNYYILEINNNGKAVDKADANTATELIRTDKDLSYLITRDTGI